MPKVSLKVQGNNAFVRRLNAKVKQVKLMVGDEIEASTFRIQDQATVNIKAIPFQKSTGVAASSIYQRMDRSKLIGSVNVGVRYAPYIEFGTGTTVDVPQGLEEYAAQFKGEGIKQVNLPARPFLFPAAKADRPVLVKKINSGLKRILK